MSDIIDLHPEDLFDKEAHGALTDGERARLDAHLRACSACRFERRARADFADEDAAHAVVARLDLAALVAATPSVAPAPSAPEPAPAPAPRPASVPPRPPVRTWARTALVAAAALLVVSVSGAGVQHWVRSLAHDAPSASETVATKAVGTSVAAPPSAPHGVRSSGSIPAAAAVPPEESSTSEPPATALAPSATIVPVSLTAVAPPRAPVVTAASLFDDAAQARRRGDHARALELHRQLEARFPTSHEAHVSYATTGLLLLDRGDARAALDDFDAYRARGTGELDEAVLAGRARALERLGRDDEARAAWRALLDATPTSPYARHARARIEGFGPP